MPVETLGAIPEIIEAGTTVRFTEDFADFPATAWTCALKLSRDGTAATSIAATTNGSQFVFVIPSTTTDDLTPGEWNYSFRVTATSGGDVATAKTGVLTVLPDLGGTVAKSAAAAQLAALETAILAVCATENASGSFNGQSYTKKNLAELYDARARLRAEVAAEEEKEAALRGRPIKRTIAPRFA